MKMIVWAACDNFAVMMADRRLFNSRAVANPAGYRFVLGEHTLGEDDVKAFTAGDGRDITGVAGSRPARMIG
jgi:hypothetical protein